jgi:hypothetical protein
VKLKSFKENQPISASGPLPMPASSAFFWTMRASGGHHSAGAPAVALGAEDMGLAFGV